MSKKSRHATDDISWPKEQTRDAARMRQSIAWVESSRQQSMTEELPESLRKDAERRRGYLEDLAGKPSLWRRVQKEPFQALLFQQVLAFGTDEDPERITRMMELCPIAEERLTVQERQRLITYVAEFIPRYHIGLGRVFNPFMHLERSSPVVTTAVLNFASLYNEPDSESQWSGPEAVMQLLPVVDSARRGMFVAGLLMLGDRRNLPLLHGVWDQLDEEGKVQIAQSHSGFMYAATAEFYLDWMDAVDEQEFGVPCAGLQSMRMRAATDEVIDVERDIPIVTDYNANPVRRLRKWTVDEYAREIEPRLRSLLAREGPEKSIPFVMKAWGIPWTPANDEEARMHRLMRAQVQSIRGASERLH